MRLPNNGAWPETSRHLHQAARLIELVRILTLEPRALYLQLALDPRPGGLSGGRLPEGGELTLAFAAGELRFEGTAGDEARWSLPAYTQATLLEALLSTLEDAGAIALPAGGESHTDRLFAALDGRRAVPARADVTGGETLSLDPETAAAYANVLDDVFDGMARFRARLAGTMSPVVVWPHHFDLSWLWFHGDALDDYQPHLNFGFAPFSDGLPRPYLYAYAYPYHEGASPPTLPAPARWHTAGWTGVVLELDDIPADLDLARHVERTAAALFPTLKGMLDLA